MGVPYYQNVSQWSKGEYSNANHAIDQLSIIASQNNVQFRNDDTGDALATSRYLEIFDNYTAKGEGLIEQTGDTDAFQFTTTGGNLSLVARPAAASPNLAIQASLFDAADTLLATSAPQNALSAEINTNVGSGTYTFRVTGVGRNNPLINGFSAYDSMGYYSITGLLSGARLPARFIIPENATNGTFVGTVAPLQPNGDLLQYRITSGNSLNTFQIDHLGRLFVQNSADLDYELLAREQSALHSVRAFCGSRRSSESVID